MRSYAILPAAGHSRRMGQPKLLMRWGASTVAECVLRAWQASQVDKVVVVVRPDDRALISICQSLDVDVVIPAAAPAEMKHSVQLGLEYLITRVDPDPRDMWLLSPADTPNITTAIIDHVLAVAHFDDASRIVIPVYGGRRGHPVAFSWRIADQVFALGDEEGVNTLVGRHTVLECTVDDRGILEDLDTPEQYGRLRPSE